MENELGDLRVIKSQTLSQASFPRHRQSLKGLDNSVPAPVTVTAPVTGYPKGFETVR